jgi:hypothetical protein
MEAIMAICAKSCAITIDSGTYESHSVELTRGTTLVDVTHFGSGAYGDFLGCGLNGTITAQMYNFPTLVPGDIVGTTVVRLDYTPDVALTFSNCVVETFNTSYDAKGGVVNNTLSLRIVGDPSIGS